MPTDPDVGARIRCLEQTSDRPARLEALRWLQKHAAATDAGLAVPVLERIIQNDPVARVRQEAAVTLFDVTRKRKRPCPLALVRAIFDPDADVRQDAAALAVQFTDFAPGTVELALRAA